MKLSDWLRVSRLIDDVLENENCIEQANDLGTAVAIDFNGFTIEVDDDYAAVLRTKVVEMATAHKERAMADLASLGVEIDCTAAQLSVMDAADDEDEDHPA